MFNRKRVFTQRQDYERKKMRWGRGQQRKTHLEVSQNATWLRGVSGQIPQTSFLDETGGSAEEDFTERRPMGHILLGWENRHRATRDQEAERGRAGLR